MTDDFAQKPRAVKVIIEVTAGVLLGTPMPEYFRQFTITSEDYHDKESYEAMKVYGFAQEYMRWLWNPQVVNWVRCDWIFV